MAARGVDVLLLSVGADLPYLTGYEAMPLERLTMLVLPVDGDATLVVPRLEAPRVAERPGVFRLRPWEETEDPVDIVAGLCGAPRVAAIGDRTWSVFLLGLQRLLPRTRFVPASGVVGPVRAVKDPAEIDVLMAAGRAVDEVLEAVRAGRVPLVGRTEAAVAAEVARMLIDAGHRRVNFTIVASGPNAASPHHEPGDRVIRPGEVVLFDIGGTYPAPDGPGYCSDSTRCVWIGEPPAEAVEIWEVLRRAQQRGVEAARVGATCEDVDAAARGVIAEAGLGAAFVHRTGHGIGIEEHEPPWIVAGNGEAVVAGNAFSIEPGVYLPGRFGFRLEDIVVATDGGPVRCNHTGRDLAVVDG